ncbi:MAG: TIGR00341 family protein [Armatimonadota bacterium]
MKLFSIGFGLFPRIQWINPHRSKEVYVDVLGLSMPTRAYYFMAALSAVIASYGLLANNTAVVIGAMLVAPLMGPIFGIALGLTTSDGNLIRRAVISEVSGVALVIGISFAVGVIPFRPPFGIEIMARTQPTIYDIVIALASGIAGTYALIDKRVSTPLPGVAIATALVPPLAVCGLCISASRWGQAAGAFMLFLANLLAIEIAAAVLFRIFGVSSEKEVSTGSGIKAFVSKFGVSIALLIVMAVFMTHTLIGIVTEAKLNRQVKEALVSEFDKLLGVRLTGVEVQKEASEVGIVAFITTPQPFESDDVSRLENKLKDKLRKNIRLVVRSLVSSDVDKHGPAYVTSGELQNRLRAEQENQMLTRVNERIKTFLSVVPGARLIELWKEETNGAIEMVAVVRTPVVVDPSIVRELEVALGSVLKRPVHLVVRSVIARDVDSSGLVYERAERRLVSHPEDTFCKRLKDALTNQLALVVPGALVKGVRWAKRKDSIPVLAVVRVPRVVTPVETTRIQKVLRRYIDPKIVLIVRSELGADTADVGYLKSVNEMLFARANR